MQVRAQFSLTGSVVHRDAKHTGFSVGSSRVVGWPAVDPAFLQLEISRTGHPAAKPAGKRFLFGLSQDRESFSRRLSHLDDHPRVECDAEVSCVLRIPPMGCLEGHLSGDRPTHLHSEIRVLRRSIYVAGRLSVG